MILLGKLTYFKNGKVYIKTKNELVRSNVAEGFNPPFFNSPEMET
jgi:hypothetical protein